MTGGRTGTGLRHLRTDSEGPNDALLTAGRALLYPGLALTSLLLLRGPAELPIGDILIAMAGLLGALSLARSELRIPRRLVVAGMLVAVGALIASTMSSEPSASVGIGARLAYMVLVIPWILLTLLTEQRHVVRAVLWLLAGAALCALGALLQFTVGDVIPGGAISADNRFTGFTTHPSDLAGITAMAAGGALGAVFSPLQRHYRRIAVVILAVAVMGLLLSGSVSGMLALCAVVLVLIVRGAITLRRAVLLGAAGTIVIGFAISRLTGAGALDPLQRLLLTTGQTAASEESNTAGIRLELAIRAVAAIIERPLTGHGLLPADNIVLRTFAVHNNFLAAWHAGGVLVFLGVVIASALAVRGQLGRTLSDPLSSSVAAAVVAALAFAQTAPGVYNRYYWLPIAFAIVLAVRRRAGHSPAGAPARALGPRSATRGAAPGAA